VEEYSIQRPEAFVKWGFRQWPRIEIPDGFGGAEPTYRYLMR
jgi:hypothetical protein